MSTELISKADTLFVGKGRDGAISTLNGRVGVPWSPKFLVSLGTPALYDADYLIKAATGTEIPDAAETVTYEAADDEDASPVDSAATTTTIYPYGSSTAVTVWDVRDGATYGRTLDVAVTHGSSVVAMTILISGYDVYKRAVTQSYTITAGTTSKSVAGTKAFAYVESVALTAASNASANTVNVGTGSVLGLPYKLEKIGHLTSASIGGVQELINVASNATVVAAVTSTASATTGDTRGTITFNTALNGTKEPFVEMYVSGRQTGAGIAGVTQA